MLNRAANHMLNLMIDDVSGGSASACEIVGPNLKTTTSKNNESNGEGEHRTEHTPGELNKGRIGSLLVDLPKTKIGQDIGELLATMLYRT